jgi:predicted nucleic acid-binding protein
MNERSRYLLDANILAGVFLGRRGAVALVDPWITNREAATSILVYGEVVEYAMGFADYDRRLMHLQTLLDDIVTYPVTHAIMERYAALRRSMRSSGLIGDIDTLIAATALEYGLTIVTTDSDFTRVPGLAHRVIPLQAIK